MMRVARALFLAILLSPLPLLAQGSGRVSGTVTDEAGNPLPGASVVLVGTHAGVVVAANGRYLLPGVPAGTRRLTASLLGYAPRSVSVVVQADKTVSADFRLTTQAIALQGIVAVGYGTQRRRDVTGAVASVKTVDIQQIPTANAIETIKGKVAGVDVVHSGNKPGDGVRVRVRGARSINAGNDPLYVLDGVPLSGGIGDFDPDDIQSIEVLKDASATAIYGSRGANGVVLISTRQGRPGRTEWTYDTYVGTQQIYKEIPMNSGADYAQLKREAYRTVGKYNCPASAKQCDAGDQGIFSPAELASLASGASTDWQSLIKRNGLQQSHNLRVSGGNEQTRFSVSGSYFDQNGVTRGMGFIRRSAGLTFDHATGRLRVGLTSNVVNSTQELSRGDDLWDEALRDNPLGPAYDSTGAAVFLPTPDGLRSNPLFDIANWQRENQRTRVFGSAYADIQLLDGLNFRSTFGPDITYEREGQFRGSLTNSQRGGQSDAWSQRDQTFAYTLSNLLTLDRTFGTAHHVAANLLYEIQQNEFDRQSANVLGLPYEYQLWYNLGTANTVTGVASTYSQWRLQSYMARVNYSFRDKYLLTLSGREDGSSRLAAGHKYAFFPSASIGWRLGQEDFVRRLGFFDDLKLRLSYGRTGNTSISPYQTLGDLARTAYAFGSSESGAFGWRPDDLANPDLKWETTDQYNAGVDFGVLGGRVTGTADFYIQNTHDLLLNKQLPQSTGFTDVLENVGATRNRGIEIGISTINVQNWHGLRWTSDLSWSTNHNEIVSLFGGKVDDVGSGWFIGQPANVYYDYKFAGIWQTADSLLAARYKQKPGQIRVADLNGDSAITSADRMIIGRHYNFPRWEGSLSNRFAWRNFDLSALAYARWGFNVSSEFEDKYNSLFGRYNNYQTNYWLPDNPSNTDPRPNADQEFPIYGSSRRYKDGSFVRVRNITAGYTVPVALAQRVGARTLRLYATAQDPWIFTHYNGFDPESGTGGNAPPFRTLLLGANVGF